jgi:hypothetical protein
MLSLSCSQQSATSEPVRGPSIRTATDAHSSGSSFLVSDCVDARPQARAREAVLALVSALSGVATSVMDLTIRHAIRKSGRVAVEASALRTVPSSFGRPEAEISHSSAPAAPRRARLSDPPAGDTVTPVRSPSCGSPPAERPVRDGYGPDPLLRTD